MEKKRTFLIILFLLLTFLLVYTPHYNYPFPRHIDEWQNITEATKIANGEYNGGAISFHFGFQLVLFLLSKIFNLVLIYQLLPAFWAVFSAIVLFCAIYRKSGNNFRIALFSIIFFASIKSNVNITGLWFFTSLTFSIPFIFLYIYFFSEGIEKRNKRFILSSFAIMAALLFFQPISVLFAVPFLIMYSLFNMGYIKKEWKFFSIFLLFPIIGLLFYKLAIGVPLTLLAENLFRALQFNRGWGVLEINNSFLALYSLIGYILAVLGFAIIFKNKENFKKYFIYGLWPVTVLLMIIIYKITGVSYLSPYQRNLYYFAISLPMLSAFGLDYLFIFVRRLINKLVLSEEEKENFKKVALALIFIVVMIFSFRSYFKIPEQIGLYEVIDENDYRALLFLSTLPRATVIATPRISVALYPISRQWPVADLYFYSDRKGDVEKFFISKDCEARQEILNRYKPRYVLLKYKINCGWNLIYDKGDYIYEINYYKINAE